MAEIASIFSPQTNIDNEVSTWDTTNYLEDSGKRYWLFDSLQAPTYIQNFVGSALQQYPLTLAVYQRINNGFRLQIVVQEEQDPDIYAELGEVDPFSLFDL